MGLFKFSHGVSAGGSDAPQLLLGIAVSKDGELLESHGPVEGVRKQVIEQVVKESNRVIRDQLYAPAWVDCVSALRAKGSSSNLT